jgi:hypothetical protein
LPVLPQASARRLAIELAAAALARLFLNTARRFAYPFAPALARGLDVPLTHVTSLVALNQGTGLLTPLEFTMVTAVGLITEVLPDARGTMMGALSATSSTGRMLGALTGGYVWLWGGLAATGCAAGLLSALALGSLVWGLRGWHPRPL